MYLNQYICIYNLYKSLGILLNENDKLKNSPVSFLRKKHNSMSSFLRGASKVILNDFPFNFGRYTSMQLNANRGSYRTILFISNWMCFLWIYSTSNSCSLCVSILDNFAPVAHALCHSRGLDITRKAKRTR